jgi:hypothetical protein
MIRYQQRMASGSMGESLPRRMPVRVAVCSIVVAAVGLTCWLLRAYLVVFAVGNLAFPFLVNTGNAPGQYRQRPGLRWPTAAVGAVVEPPGLL